ncbi:MAG TPA: glycosyltransferase [Devosia sp.]|nr:glycosyltransferase [Devosia sp.]
MDLYRGNRVAVILPCFNEAPAIAGVVAGFRAAIPAAAVHVFDNASSDDTAAVAQAAGAAVTRVGDRGKGNVVRRMFADVEADIYLMADGDGTYDAAAARMLVDALIDGGVDVVVGVRQSDGAQAAYRRGHATGNRALTGAVAHIFGGEFTDMLSGYRAMSRRFVKSFPALSKGFEIETELTIHALELKVPCAEVPTRYSERHAGTASKLSTWRDGLRIVRTILRLHMLERPLAFYLTLALAGFFVSLWLGVPVILEFVETGLVPRFPTAIAAVGAMLAAALSAACAMILDSVVTGRREARRLVYLSIPRTQDCR